LCYHSRVIVIEPYIDRNGNIPFARWFDSLDDNTAARITKFLDRLENGNLSNIKSVGAGVMELRIDFGPGFRIYLGKDGETLVVLLGGGTKKRQQLDVAAAQVLWHEYKLRKREK